RRSNPVARRDCLADNARSLACGRDARLDRRAPLHEPFAVLGFLRWSLGGVAYVRCLEQRVGCLATSSNPLKPCARKLLAFPCCVAMSRSRLPTPAGSL